MSYVMKMSWMVVAVLAIGIPSASAQLLDEDFDSYTAGSDLIGQGGWFAGQPGNEGDPTVSDAQSVSGNNSLQMGVDDQAWHATGIGTNGSGKWSVSTQLFVPDDDTVDGAEAMNFSLVNSAADDLVSRWKVSFDSGRILIGSNGLAGFSKSVPRGVWGEVRMEIDLDNDFTEFFYNDESIGSAATSGNKDVNDILIFDDRADGGSVFFDDIRVTAFGAGVAGDFDGDNDVDGADFLKWQRDSGDAAELALWETNFGTTAAAAAVASVPEPATGLLLVVGLGLLAARRRVGG